ncbi:MAG: hypothetical protein IKY21_00115 [Clostridia bacterium]|nr:hypothetical protein [Clostridia bacterium]
MYNRNFGGIKSEGQLYNYEREYNESRERAEREAERETSSEAIKERPEPACDRKKGLKLDFLRDLRLDDLILIAIGLLLLLDSDGDNDLFVLIIAFLLFF